MERTSFGMSYSIQCVIGLPLPGFSESMMSTNDWVFFGAPVHARLGETLSSSPRLSDGNSPPSLKERLVSLSEPENYAGGRFISPGRATHARKVDGESPD